MMLVLLPLLGQDHPMSIEHITPANQFHSQNTNTPLQSAYNDHCSVTTDSMFSHLDNWKNLICKFQSALQLKALRNHQCTADSDLHVHVLQQT